MRQHAPTDRCTRLPAAGKDEVSGQRFQTPVRCAALVVVLVMTVSGLTGCSLFVMAGKMLFGDPVRQCSFKQATRVDLAKGDKKVLVYCTAPHSIQAEFESVDYVLVDKITRHLKNQGVAVINPNQVKTWMDEHGPARHPSELVADFDADYIVHIELQSFSQHEDNSPTLYRGTLSGSASAWEVVEENGRKRAWQVFFTDFTSVYPQFSPLSQHQISSQDVFVRQCMEEASGSLARMFYDHRVSEVVN